MTAAEMERKETERVMQRKTEEGKQCFCVSHQVSVVQFLLLSSTGNDYQEGRLPGQLALFSLLHAFQMFEDIFISSIINCSLINAAT